MQMLTPDGQQLISNIAARYNLSNDAVLHMLGAVNNGGGTMAQFNSPELGGSGQWMRGGMTMVGDMFNQGLQSTVNNLCNELADGLAAMQVYQPAPAGQAPSSNQWWPAKLGQPFSSGAQNNTRYAVFANRLAVEINGNITVYDTLDNNIGGVSQQQGGDSSLTFSSQYGTIAVNSLPIVSGQGTDIPPAPVVNFAEPIAVTDAPDLPVMQEIPEAEGTTTAGNTDEIIELIAKLAKLRDASAISDDEFNTKKTELLSRL